MPRAGLSREAVVAIALDLVDVGGAPGFAELTLASVADIAGVATPSLYKHVSSLRDLRREVAIRAMHALTRAGVEATLGLAGDDALRALMHGWRCFAHDHPGWFAAVQFGADPDDPDAGQHEAAAADSVAVVVGALRGFALPECAWIDAVRAVRSALYGFVNLELTGGFRLPDDVDRSFAALVEIVVAGVRTLGPEVPIAAPTFPTHQTSNPKVPT